MYIMVASQLYFNIEDAFIIKFIVDTWVNLKHFENN